MNISFRFGFGFELRVELVLCGSYSSGSDEPGSDTMFSITSQHHNQSIYSSFIQEKEVSYSQGTSVSSLKLHRSWQDSELLVSTPTSPSPMDLSLALSMSKTTPFFMLNSPHQYQLKAVTFPIASKPAGPWSFFLASSDMEESYELQRKQEPSSDEPGSDTI
ncbi:hypothetical protein DY000_02032404 [Brassica cretica]|uniref:Uncharacterized protein n=1 Tax=Brassica cretica TaxID=69181 RepID=A0ABQ7DHH8_BRACR|nr:hypothetical protein DY000_02032404 [Brassica cretica]